MSEHLVQEAINYLEKKFKESMDGADMTDSKKVKQYLRLKIGSEQEEKFAVFFLNNQMELIKFEILFSGSVNIASVYPRVVIKKALEYNARALILGHNHPSGHVEPSRADQELTKTLQNICEALELQIVDHIIVTPTGEMSFAEYGWL